MLGSPPGAALWTEVLGSGRYARSVTHDVFDRRKAIMKSSRNNQVAGLRDSVRAVFYVGVTNLSALISGFASPARSLRPVLVPVRARRRGAGMLEYALIAAIAVGVFIFLREFFNDLFQNLTGDIGDNLESPVEAP
jgi:Flp pilus assembly pilin Flp